MTKTSANDFGYTFKNLFDDLSFQVVGGDYTSRPLHITVHPNPALLWEPMKPAPPVTNIFIMSLLTLFLLHQTDTGHKSNYQSFQELLYRLLMLGPQEQKVVGSALA